MSQQLGVFEGVSEGPVHVGFSLAKANPPFWHIPNMQYFFTWLFWDIKISVCQKEITIDSFFWSPCILIATYFKDGILGGTVFQRRLSRGVQCNAWLWNKSYLWIPTATCWRKWATGKNETKPCINPPLLASNQSSQTRIYWLNISWLNLVLAVKRSTNIEFAML